MPGNWYVKTPCWIVPEIRTFSDKKHRKNRMMFVTLFVKMCLLRDSHEKYGRARQAIIWHEKGAVYHPCDEDKYLLSCNMELLISRFVKFCMYIGYGCAHAFCMKCCLKVRKYKIFIHRKLEVTYDEFSRSITMYYTQFFKLMWWQTIVIIMTFSCVCV